MLPSTSTDTEPQPPVAKYAKPPASDTTSPAEHNTTVVGSDADAVKVTKNASPLPGSI